MENIKITEVIGQYAIGYKAQCNHYRDYVVMADTHEWVSNADTTAHARHIANMLNQPIDK
jgi:hypothetical protein